MSADWMVESLCAMMILVRPSMRWSNASCTSRSVLVSSALVASSRMRTSGSASMALAIAMRCFSPPESLSPRSPTCVSQPSESDSMNSSIFASLHAFLSSFSVIPSRTYSRLCRIVSLKSVVSWNTAANFRL